MALGFIKKVFSFGKDKAGTDGKPQEDSALERARENVSFDEALSEAEAHPIVEKDPVSELEIETAGGPAPDADAALSDDQEEEDAPLLPGAEQAGDIGVVPLSLLQAEAAAEEQAEVLPEAADAVLDADAMDALLDEAEAAGAVEPPAVSPILPKGFAAASEREEPVAEAPQPKLSWFQRLRAGLARTSSQLTTQISALFTKRKLDEDTLDELEDLLIQSDLGVETAMRITGALSSERYGKDVSGEDVARIMAGEITKVLKPVAKPLELDLSHKPHVILVVGVNGTGKTTTIGKLASKLSGSGLKVMLAAGDTFRAAAIEQLKIWADRTGSQFIGTKLGADASGLAYDAYEQARAQKSDVLIIDTAGRLQNKTELMAELEKIVRVLGKLDPDAPHTVLQTLDATTGQNALNQVEIFRNVAGVSGLIMTKLDGTARGGILVAIAAKHKLPVYFIGVGEGVDDLEPFEAEDFAKAIAGV
ncbi:Signal recognition particle receptor FtsY [Agrobacterium fabacearum CFBP 5771]|jgi:fused signal recognition particle receptor|uniref:signal recognition particle-docking protein FtsY n=1 Tax=Rhizobium/Agrobacterium group TaxID=227290 RepID=UPI0001FC607B|nr:MULTISPECIES: signal recognition particle-docking protein FtsY [Rhizobium/Agrobacterium group]ADY65608.1 cell division particle [Agrobacterium tumefaciens]KAA3501131.1 signal recognition particle-docking protein FtsY [Agrobacterium tumefaciens]KQY43337.1 signal recognition particle-docking protein FtsY [Rhizobium sp. Root491]MDR5010258.1 signal recognition particle-docking protein FtsY [Agrobacterium tumefaciens]NSY49442.1 signal recognition particle-docking protein FtsY [Agrobacterium tume